MFSLVVGMDFIKAEFETETQKILNNNERGKRDGGERANLRASERSAQDPRNKRARREIVSPTSSNKAKKLGGEPWKKSF